ncbi:MAG: DNA-binding protein WhiA [Acidobacteriota bacterium]
MVGVTQSYSGETKNELARLVPETRCCCAAELSALLKLNGGLELAGRDHMTLTITTENAGIGRLAFKLFKKLFDFPVSVVIESRRRLKTSKAYVVRAQLDRVHLEALRELGIMDTSYQLLYGIDSRVIEKPCCKRAFLRGVFLARGSVSKPESAYHLEILFPNEEMARAAKKLGRSKGIRFHRTERKHSFVLYLKESEQIVDYLRLIGASYALLEFENVRIFKSMKNQVNRIVNCETANLEKTLDASMRQTDLIRRLIDKVSVHGLPDHLRQLAILRLDYPDCSLKELGEMMSPPLTKSGVAYRMKKLEALAERLL